MKVESSLVITGGGLHATLEGAMCTKCCFIMHLSLSTSLEMFMHLSLSTSLEMFRYDTVSVWHLQIIKVIVNWFGSWFSHESKSHLPLPQPFNYMWIQLHVIPACASYRCMRELLLYRSMLVYLTIQQQEIIIVSEHTRDKIRSKNMC